MNELIEHFEEKYMSVNAIDVDFRVYYFLTKYENITKDNINTILEKIKGQPFANPTMCSNEIPTRSEINQEQLADSINKGKDFSFFFQSLNSDHAPAQCVEIELKFSFSETHYCVINLEFEEKITWSSRYIPVFDKLTDNIFKAFDCLYGFQYVSFWNSAPGTNGVVNYMLEKMKNSVGIKFKKIFYALESKK